MDDYRIWKYPLEITDDQTINFTCVGRILSVQEQDGVLALWVHLKPPRISEDDKRVRLHVKIIGTGNSCSSMAGWEFAGSVQTMGNKLVWHVFYKWEE